MYKVMTFNCKGQYIVPPREEPIADSIKYLQAKFVFAEAELIGTVSAIFKSYAGVAYTVPLDAEYSCEIPAEVIKAPGFYVSLFGSTAVDGSLKTYESKLVKLNPSGYTSGVTPADPDETTYAEILALMDGKVDYIGTMPTASAGYLDKVYVYTGADTAEYLNGNLYKCSFNGDIYSWVHLISLDSTPTAESGKPITSGAVYAALAGKSPIGHNHDSAYAPLGHVSNTENPHSVTKAQVGLGSVDNTADVDKPVSTAQAAELAQKSPALHDHNSAYAPISHASKTDNPHSVTKSQVGLGDVDNTPDLDKPVSNAQSLINTAKADKVSAPTAGNFARLDANGNLEDSGKKASDYQDKITASGILKSEGTNVTGAQAGTDYATPEQVALKQDALTFDDAPTAGSDNPVKSGGIYEYIFAKQYGVRFSGGANTGATAIRLYNAAGLIANVGTDTVTAINDFDSIYPWSARKRCCGVFNASGDFTVNAYKGEPGYTEDGSNGEVWVEHSLFYYKHTYTGDVEEIVISDKKLADMLPAPVFINPDGSIQQKAYTAAYPMATVGGVATSRAGVFSDICSLNSAMVTARTLGANYTAQTTAEWYTECLYMWVEFATRNLQSIMNGACSMTYDATHTAVIAETGINRIIIANAKAAAYVVGQTILIGTSLGTSGIANNRIITAIADYDADNKAITFDGTAVNIAVGNIVCSSAWINGYCNSVLSSSGSPVSNTDGKRNCVYRGKETPYGNAYDTICDVLFKREGAGTTESPYTYDIYFLSDPTKYNAGTITSDYVKLNYQAPTADGYVIKLGKDSRFPFLRIPSQIGASTTTYYSDYYYYPRDAVSAARVGGGWFYGSIDGPCCWNCYYAPSSSNVYYRARLSYHRT